MKTLSKVLFATLFLSTTIAFAQDNNTDNHQVSIVIPQISLLDIEPEASKDISITMVAPSEAGDALANQTDNNLWLNVTSIVASGNTRSISTSIDAAVTGLDLKVVAGAYTGAGFGSWGSPATELTLGTTSQDLVTGIKSGYTFNGDGNGYRLTYTVAPKGDNTFGDIVADTENITVTYTLTP